MNIDKEAALDDLFNPFQDIVSIFYKKQKNKLLTTGIELKLTDYLHFSQFPENGKGGRDYQDFILINLNQKYTGASVFFSKSINSFLPCFFTLNEKLISKEYLSLKKDYSVILQTHLISKNICFFEDESYEFALYSGDICLPGSWNFSKDSKNHVFATNLSQGFLLKQIEEHGIHLNVKLKKEGRLRNRYESICNIDYVLSDCYYSFCRLIREKHYYERNFHHFNKALTLFNITTGSRDLTDFINKLNSLSMSNFEHLDFINWEELFLNFRIVQDSRGFFQHSRLFIQHSLESFSKNKPISIYDFSNKLII